VRLFAALAVVAALAGVAAADDVRLVRRMGFAERSGNLVVTMSLPELFDRSAVDKISSGFPSSVVVRMYVFRKDRTDQPVSLVLIEHEIVFDLWDEVYVLRTRGPLGKRELRYKNRQQAVRAMTELDHMPIAPLDRIAIGPHHFLAAVIELNPISPELLAEMRRWLTRPAGESLDSSSSFFGSFVSVFVNPKLDHADRTLRVRSQPFYRTPR